jgi:MscS family membrane protein
MDETIRRCMHGVSHLRFLFPMMAISAMLFTCLSHGASRVSDDAASPVKNQLPALNVRATESVQSDSSDTPDQNLLVAIEKKTPQTGAPSEIYPLNLNSPRGTLWSLLVVLNNYKYLLETNGRTFENQDHLDWIQKRIASCIEVEDVAPKFQSAIATDAAVRIRSIIMRTPMAGWESIPDASQITKTQFDSGQYRFEMIPIVMKKIPSGDRCGQWIISRSTRDTAEETLGHLINNRSGTGPLAVQTFTDGKDSLYKNHFFQSGWLIPSKLIMNLPDFAGIRIIGQSLWKWALVLITVLTIIAMIVVAYLLLISRIRGVDAPHKNQKIRDGIIKFIFQMVIGCLMVVFQILIENQIFLNGTVLETLSIVANLIMAFAFIFALLSLSSVIAEVIVRLPYFNHNVFDEAFIRIIIKSVAIIFAAVFLFQILKELGFTPTTILAGAGVTGLALALSAQDLLKNFLASVILLIEKPFKKGDYVQFANETGIICSIGMRSTSLMSSDGNMLYLPNSKISQGQIENFTHRPHIRSRITVGMTYSTNYQRMNRAMTILREILEEKVLSPEGKIPSVLFKSFEESSLILEAKVIHRDTSGSACRNVLSEINLEILRRFNEEQLEFAFPTISIDAPEILKTVGQAT